MANGKMGLPFWWASRVTILVALVLSAFYLTGMRTKFLYDPMSINFQKVIAEVDFVLFGVVMLFVVFSLAFVTTNSIIYLSKKIIGVGAIVGAIVGTFVGPIVVGTFVGAIVGVSIGASIGAIVGAIVGASIGASIGAIVEDIIKKLATANSFVAKAIKCIFIPPKI